MELKYTQARHWARDLYVNLGKTIKETADLVETDEATVRCWILEGSWDVVIQSKLVSKETEIKYLYQSLENVRQKMDTDKTTKSIDLYNKYVEAIRKLEGNHSIASIVEVFEDFLNWLRRRDLALAKTIIPYMDKFIHDRYNNSTM